MVEMAKPRRATLLTVSVWLLMCTLIALFDPTHLFIHRRDFDNAAAAFHQDPTPENEAALRREEEKNQAIRNEARVLEGVGLFIGGILCYGIYAGIRSIFSSRPTANRSEH
jgi:hypothetical protein